MRGRAVHAFFFFLFFDIGVRGDVGGRDEVFQRFEQIAEKVLVDEMRIFGQTFQHSALQARGPHFQDTEIGDKDKFQRFGLHAVAFFVADDGVRFLKLFFDRFMLL